MKQPKIVETAGRPPARAHSSEPEHQARCRAPHPAVVPRRVAADRTELTPAELTQVHRMVGNRGLRRLLAAGGLRAKLRVGTRGDRHEREADRLAARALDPAGAPGTVQERMERVLGADLRGVRIHADARADTLNDALRSRAFTIGSDVYVRRGEYRPGTARGDALLAHELAHTVQPGATDVIRRAPTFESMDNAYATMSERVEGLAIVDFIERVRRTGDTGVPDGSRGAFTWNDLLAVFATGRGKDFVADKWRDKPHKPWGANQVIQGQHEWIETATVNYVIGHAVRGPNLVSWLMALDMLRIPTKEVIFPPKNVMTAGLTETIASANANPANFTASSLKIFSGHQGAMYGIRPAGGKTRKPQDTYRQLTTYAGKFHGQLKKLLERYLDNDTDDLQGFMNALIQFQEDQVWGGDIPGLDEERAKQITNDLRDSKTATAGLFGGFQNVAEIQGFAGEAKQRNTGIMANRVNAIVQHQSNLGFGTGGYWSTLPKKPVYVTDESGMTVDDYTHMEEDDTEQQTPYTVPTTQARDVPAPLEAVPEEQRFGNALFAEQQQLEARTGAVNAEVTRLINQSYQKEKAGLTGVTDAAKALAALNAKYGDAMSEAQDHFDEYRDARQRLDVWLSAQQTTKTTGAGLQQLYQEYCVKANGLLDKYVADIKTLFGA